MVVTPKQEILEDIPSATSLMGFSGHNHAYYTQVDAKYQLFRIRDFSVYPDPPRLNEHNFLLLEGLLEEEHPGLEDATLIVAGGCFGGYGELNIRIADSSHPIMRRHPLGGHGYEYGGPLTTGFYNEILYDQFWLYGPWPKPIKSNCSFEVTARLPDERVLFSFGMDFAVQWPPSSM
ncbi:hypothetical protein K491DRAFT_723255 [Lophiostoma macrostomum CBS 122681]|uniref:Uncharacterized protein n=1 Tax=Lophiostoma macrostomum CBS 122681 TaxID=1314788 RepID=A0A6A6SIM6_9PLEO|nr:hypothetical protein K491DRAFT_723255 [Lophiostoma macrostomum CBS 122681]